MVVFHQTAPRMHDDDPRRGMIKQTAVMDMVAANDDPADLQRGIFFRLPAVSSEPQHAPCPQMMQMIVPESQVAAG